MEEPPLVASERLLMVAVGSVRPTCAGSVAAAKLAPERAVTGARLTTDHFSPAASAASMVPRVSVE